MVPNGTIVKLTPKTVFKIEAVLGRDQGSANSFTLLTGKLRTVAAKLSGSPTAYSIRTPTAAGAVRGTDFAMMVAEGQKDWICVQEGQVEFTKLDPVTGEVLGTLDIKAGEFADTFSPVFEAAPVSSERLAQLFSDLNFAKLDPAQVPGKAPSTAPAVEEPAEPVDGITPVVTPGPGAPAPSGGTPPAAAAPGPAKDKDPIMAFLAEALGFQVGSITIDGVTYAKAIIQPKLHTDSFKIGLYLPVIYKSDLFNPSDWYHPRGNDEWSFGTDQVALLDMVTDGLMDLMLKIRYVEIGRQGTDSFFLKVGNLSTMTMGHGSLVKNFANDQDFPSIRRLGLNTGFKTENFAWEGLFDDLSDLQVVGTRFALGTGMFEVGVNAIADLYIAKNYNSNPVENPRGNYGNPALLGFALDTQLFKFDLGLISSLGFADVGAYAPYFRDAPVTLLGKNPIAAGFATDGVFANGTLKNFLISTGVYGKILLLIDYELAFRFTKGLAKVSLFNGTYNRGKMAYLDDIMNYLDGTTTSEVDGKTTMGIYGSAGADILGMVQLKAGYFWPWSYNSDGTITWAEDDNLEVTLTIPKGKIPMIKVSGSITYQRTHFAPTVASALLGTSGQGVNLFDSNTVFGGELVYGMMEGLDMALQVSTSVVRDASGQVLYENGQPMIRPSINIESRISF
ncbi:MAG: hypothetical protein A2Z96_07635 [Spirochaetes bacterium GWB1_48_6]|nr:MAG: hypothetical protein A2Z96_07635 [Spirochaetes bacterium GWB1_48_6]